MAHSLNSTFVTPLLTMCVAYRNWGRYAEVDPLREILDGYIDVGTTSARVGDRYEALRIAAQLESIDRPHAWGLHTLWRPRIAAVLGDPELAVELLRKAHSQGWSYGPQLHQDIDLQLLRDYPPFQEFMRPKG